MRALPSRLLPPIPAALGTLVAVALGCGGGGDDKKDGKGASGGDDSGELEQPDINWTGECPAASGFGTSTRWEYQYTEAYEEESGLTGTRVVEITEVGGDGTLTLVSTEEYTGTNNSYVTVVTDTVGCDGEGLWLIDRYREYEVTVYKPYEGFYDYTWNAPAMLIPVEVDVGTEWETVYDGTYVNEVGATRAADDVVVTTVTGLESVEVPAGTYTAMVWEQDSELTVPVTVWYVLGTGFVRSEELELTSFSP